MRDVKRGRGGGCVRQDDLNAANAGMCDCDRLTRSVFTLAAAAAVSCRNARQHCGWHVRALGWQVM